MGTESDKPENSKSKNPGDISQSGEGWQTGTPTPRGCSQPSPSRLSPARGRTGLCSPRRQDRGRPGAGGSPASRAGDPSRPLLTCGSMASTGPHAPGAPAGRGQGAGASGTRVLSPACDTSHACAGLRGYRPDATPATFEFQPSPPFSPPSARKGQSSPSPRPRPIAAPPAPRGHTPPGRHLPLPASPAPGSRRLVTLPAALPPLPPTPPLAGVGLRFRSAPGCSTSRQNIPGQRRANSSGVGAGTLGERNRARAHGTRLGGGARPGSPPPPARAARS